MSVSTGHDIYRLRETLGAKSASMADVELVALTTDVGVHHCTVTRGHGVSDSAGLTFCSEGGLGLPSLFHWCSLLGNYRLPVALSRQYLVRQIEIYLGRADSGFSWFTSVENLALGA